MKTITRVLFLVLFCLLTSCLATSHLNTLVKGGTQFNGIKKINCAFITADSILVVNVKDVFYRKNICYCISIKDSSLQFVFNNSAKCIKSEFFTNVYYRGDYLQEKKYLMKNSYYYNHHRLYMDRIENKNEWNIYRTIDVFNKKKNNLKVENDSIWQYHEFIFAYNESNDIIHYKTFIESATYEIPFEISDHIFHYEGSKKHIWKYPFYITFDIITFPLQLYWFLDSGGFR